MKNLILTALLSLMMVLFALPECQAQKAMLDDQTVQQTENTTIQPEKAEKVGFFGRLYDKVTNGPLYMIIGLIGGILAKKGWIAKLKKGLGYGVIITHSLADLLAETSNGLSVLNNAIQDNGKLKPNSLKEIMEAKKEFMIELGDAVLTVKPKT